MTRKDSTQERFDLAGLLLVAISSLPAMVQVEGGLRDYRFEGLNSWAFAPGVHLGLTALLLAIVGRTRGVLWLLTPAAFFALPEALYMAWYKLPSGPNIYGVIADTDWAETQSWVGPWLWPGVCVAFAWLLLVGFIARSAWKKDWRWIHRSRLWVLGAATLLISLFMALQWQLSPSIARAEQLDANPVLQYSINAPNFGLLGNIESVYPWGMPLRWIHFREHQTALSEHREAARHFNFHVRRHADWPEQPREVHVLVIGETGRPDRWHLFGATRNTTPLLSAREDLILFKDAVSAASATRESVPMMLTRRPLGHPLAPSDEPSLVTAYRQAGYRSYWLSTQGAAGRHETPISVLAAEADEQHFINAVDYRGEGSLDGDLLPLLAKILARNEPRQLIVLHTLGSHLNYAHRYPREFEKFLPSLKRDEAPDIWRPTHVPELRNAYDNSVLYTDFVLNQAIALIDKSGAAATVLYAADHGESLFDGNCGRGGHGFDSELNYRVPMFIWTSALWRQAHPAALAALKSHTGAPISTLSIFATMNGLAGFDVTLPSAHGDLSQTGWVPAARELAHFGDFDRNLKGKSCSSKAAASS